LIAFEQLMDCRVWSADVPLGSTHTSNAPRHVPVFVRYDAVRNDAGLNPVSGELVLSAVESCKPDLREDDDCKLLRVHWDKRIIPKLRDVCKDLGEWACFEAAKLLMDDLSASRAHESQYFEEDAKQLREKRMQRRPTTSAMRQLQMSAGERLQVELTKIADYQQAPCAPGAVSDKVLKLIRFLTEKGPRKCLVFVTRRLTCKLLSSLLQSLLASPAWTVAGLMAQRTGQDSFSAAEYIHAIAQFRGDLR